MPEVKASLVSLLLINNNWLGLGKLIQLSKANQAIIAAAEKGYKIDKKGNVTGPSGKKLKLMIKDGAESSYLGFKIWMNGESIFVKVHRFQAFKKFGNKMFGFDENGEEIIVRHKNSHSFDNSESNILLGTHELNRRDRYRK